MHDGATKLRDGYKSSMPRSSTALRTNPLINFDLMHDARSVHMTGDVEQTCVLIEEALVIVHDRVLHLTLSGLLRTSCIPLGIRSSCSRSTHLWALINHLQTLCTAVLPSLIVVIALASTRSSYQPWHLCTQQPVPIPQLALTGVWCDRRASHVPPTSCSSGVGSSALSRQHMPGGVPK